MHTDPTQASGWTEVKAPDDYSWESITYGNNKFVAVGQWG